MSIMGNINYMKRFAYHPCATPNPLLLIEFAFEAGLPVLFELLSADILDKALAQGKQAWRRASAKQNRSPQKTPSGTGPVSGHGRKAGGKFGRKSLGQKIGPREWLFEAVDIEQTGMYYWLVADLATEFLARWSTLIYLKQGCPFDRPCFAQGPFSGIYIEQGENTQILPILTTGAVISGGTTIQVLHPGKWSVTYTCRLLRFLSDEPPTAARVELRGGIGSGRIYQTGAHGGQNEAGGVNAGGFWHFEAKAGETPTYSLVLVNDSGTEIVGTVDGQLTLSSGFCDNSAPLVPWDANHLVPYPHGKLGVSSH